MAAVELALVMPVLLALLVGIVDFSSLFFLRNNMVTVARESARALALESVCEDEAEAMARGNLGNWNATFNVDGQGPVNPGDTDVVFTISVPMADAAPVGLLFGMIDFTGTMEAQVAMRFEGTNYCRVTPGGVASAGNGGLGASSGGGGSHTY